MAAICESMTPAVQHARISTQSDGASSHQLQKILETAMAAVEKNKTKQKNLLSASQLYVVHTSAAASDARSRVSIALLLHSCFPCRTHLRLGPAAFHSTRSAAAWWSLATAHMCTKQAAIPLIIHLWPLHLAEAVARCLTGPNVILWPPSDQVLTQLNGQNGQPLACALTPFGLGGWCNQFPCRLGRVPHVRVSLLETRRKETIDQRTKPIKKILSSASAAVLVWFARSLAIQQTTGAILGIAPLWTINRQRGAQQLFRSMLG